LQGETELIGAAANRVSEVVSNDCGHASLTDTPVPDQYDPAWFYPGASFRAIFHRWSNC
jgi:hypothetical protein